MVKLSLRVSKVELFWENFKTQAYDNKVKVKVTQPCWTLCDPDPVFLPGESHGGRSLVGCSPWSHKELGTTEQLAHMHTKAYTVL